MTLWTSLEPASTTVDPGGGATVRLRVRNTGDVVDEYRFEPVGDLAPWARVEPQSLRLYPGTTGTVEVSFAPPRTSDVAAGPHPYAVRITPTEQPEATVVPEGNVTVTPFTEVRAELVPPVVKGRLRGRPKLAVDNLGNTRVTASLAGSDNGDQLSFDLDPSNVQIEPGRAVFVKARLKPREIIWFGSKQERPYALAVQRSGVDPQSVEGTFVQRGFLPGWLATVLGMTVALAIAFVVIWLSYKPDVRSLATEQMTEVGATALPNPESDEPLAEAPKAPAEQAVPSPAVPAAGADDADGGGSGDSGGGGGEDGAEKAEPAGPLPFRPGDGPNLFVEFAQVRLNTLKPDNPCRLTAPHTAGLMDEPTVAALKCFQTQNDERYDGVSVRTDGLGNLGRSTMTTLIMAHFGSTSPSEVQTGKNNWEVPWFNSVLLWASYTTVDDGVSTAQQLWLRTNMVYLRGEQKHRASAEANAATSTRVRVYQEGVGLPATGVADEKLFASLHAGRIVSQNDPGKVTAEDYPPAPER
ncbi:COG1470 family protein [Streptomyces prasinus]